jgi:hypothetical protein
LSCFSSINSYFDQWHVRKQGLKTTHSSIVKQNQNYCRRKNCRTSHLLRLLTDKKYLGLPPIKRILRNLLNFRYWERSSVESNKWCTDVLLDIALAFQKIWLDSNCTSASQSLAKLSNYLVQIFNFKKFAKFASKNSNPTKTWFKR